MPLSGRGTTVVTLASPVPTAYYEQCQLPTHAAGHGSHRKAPIHISKSFMLKHLI